MNTGSLIGLGRLHAPDPRDHKYLLTPPRVSSERRRMYWIRRGGSLDQGGTPHCVAFSGVHWLTSYPVLNKAVDTTDLYNECQRTDEWPGEDYDGTSVRALFKVLKGRGYIGEYRWAFDADTIMKHVLMVGPVVVGTNWYMEMCATDRHGYIKPEGENVGGHAWMIDGGNLDKKNPDGTIGVARALNSWGNGWGSKGKAWITLPDLRRLMSEDGEACTATEIKRA